jgi:hypothetical protein
LKVWPRKWKDKVIESMNPEWEDLAERWFEKDSERLSEDGQCPE